MAAKPVRAARAGAAAGVGTEAETVISLLFGGGGSAGRLGRADAGGLQDLVLVDDQLDRVALLDHLDVDVAGQEDTGRQGELGQVRRRRGRGGRLRTGKEGGRG